MRISIAGFSFHGLHADGKMDIFGYLESMRYRYDLEAADIWNGMLASTDDDHIRKVREALDERELVCANYHADGPHVWEDSPDAREANYRLALTHLRIAEMLGARTVRIDTGGVVGPMTDEQLDVLASRYREYAEFGANAGFLCGPETHWGISLVADNMERIASAVDHPNYGILLHVGHFELGDEEEGDRRLARLTCHTHIDARVTNTRLEPAMAILRDVGYQGYWGVEHHSGKNEYREVEYQLACVRRVLADWGPAAGQGSPRGGPLNPLLPHLD
jgi:sugar phosphate isomerase/epimerase